MSKRTIYEGRIFTVQTETVRLPNGNELDAEIIRHPGSVVIVPVTHTGEIVLVRQFRPAIGRFAWELPAGSLKPGEDPEKAAVRECHEETGLVPGRIERLGAFYPTPGYCDELMNPIAPPDCGRRATASTRSRTKTRTSEAALSLEDMRSMIANGEIVDLKTVAGLALTNAG
jgi:ADP-ribose pyrophosphatase